MTFTWPGQSLVTTRSSTLSNASIAIAGLYVRTNKAELGLPKMRTIVQRVPMDPVHRRLYAALLGRFSADLDSDSDRADFARLGKVVMYLVMAATNPKLLRAGSSRFDPIDFRVPPLEVPRDSAIAELLDSFHNYGPPAKYIQLAEIIRRNAAAGRKTLVWSSFVRNLTSLARLLAAYEPAVIHGGTPIADQADEPTRATELARFRGDSRCQVLLANPSTLGEGISLHRTCLDAVYLDRTFNAGVYLQSIDRIHRLGLRDNERPIVTVLVSENTIDSVVDSRINAKIGRLATLLNDPVLNTLTLPDEEQTILPLDRDDAVDLLRHVRGEQIP
jgi:SNF2 family DNA or RNA helicase